MVKIYLSGPEVFLPNAVEIGRQKKDLCRLYDFEGLFPLDNDDFVQGPLDGTIGRLDRKIFSANLAMMRSADVGIFNLTPFRGPSADVGTALELGYMAGLRKSCFGYTNTSDDYLDRVQAFRDGPSGCWMDADRMEIENFGNADNLMVDGIFDQQVNFLVRFDASGRIDDLRAFEECLKRIAVLRSGGE